MVVLSIHTKRKYGLWLKKHLEKEHPKTKGKIVVSNGGGATRRVR